VRNVGIIVARFFIPTYMAIQPGMLLGDNRQFNVDPSAGYRIALAWDTTTGMISFTVSPSTIPITPISRYDWRSSNERYYLSQEGTIEGNKLVVPARPIGQPGAGNGVSVSAVDGGIVANYTGLNSSLPCCAASGRVSIAFSSAGISVHLEGNRYPNVEVIQYSPDSDPRFLAQSKMDSWGGIITFPLPVLQQFRNQTWLNGNLTSSWTGNVDPRQQYSGDPSDMPCCGI
jgi:hypothetical protein